MLIDACDLTIFTSGWHCCLPSALHYTAAIFCGQQGVRCWSACRTSKPSSFYRQRELSHSSTFPSTQRIFSSSTTLCTELNLPSSTNFSQPRLLRITLLFYVLLIWSLLLQLLYAGSPCPLKKQHHFVVMQILPRRPASVQGLNPRSSYATVPPFD